MSKKTRVFLAGLVLVILALIYTGRLCVRGSLKAVSATVVSPNEGIQSNSTEQKVSEEPPKNILHNGQLTHEANPDYEKKTMTEASFDGNSSGPDAPPVYFQSALNEKISSMDPAAFESENLKKKIVLPENSMQTGSLPEHSNFSLTGRTIWVSAEVK